MTKRLDSEMHTTSSALTAYQACVTAVTPLLAAHLLIRRAIGKESPTRLKERWGQPTQARPIGKLIWIHAVSVGEGAAVLPLIHRIQREHPSTTILVTGGTLVADKWRRHQYPDNIILQFVPIDTKRSVNRFLNHWKPDIGIFLESEFWPTLVTLSSARGVKLLLVNARLSARSATLWSLPFSRRLFTDIIGSFKSISPQNLEQRERFLTLGVDKRMLNRAADLKVATAATQLSRLSIDVTHKASFLKYVMTLVRKVPKYWIAASTHHPEELSCGRIHIDLRQRFPGLLTLIAPRHPQRSVEIASTLRALSLNVRSLSRGEFPLPDTDILLIDTVGDLPLVYAMSAGIPTFMGGSLFHGRGHNVAEATLAGCSVITGAHHSTFEPFLHRLNADNILCRVVKSEEELLHLVLQQFSDPDQTCRIGVLAAERTRTLSADTIDLLWNDLLSAFSEVRSA